LFFSLQLSIGLQMGNFTEINKLETFLLAFALGSFRFNNFGLDLDHIYSGQKQSSHGVTQKHNIPVSVI
jgi:hypothetical protein